MRGWRSHHCGNWQEPTTNKNVEDKVVNMDKSQVAGRWFSDHKILETDGDESTETRTINVTEYLKNGALNSEGHCIVKMLSEDGKTELFIKFQLSGTW